MRRNFCTYLCESSVQIPRENTRLFAVHVANGRGRRGESRASSISTLQAMSSKQRQRGGKRRGCPKIGWCRSNSHSLVIRSTRTRTKALICESSWAIQYLNSFRAGWKSGCWKRNIKGNWFPHRERLQHVVFHGISRSGSGKLVKALLLLLRVVLSLPRMNLVTPADNGLCPLILQHLLAFELRRELRHKDQ